MFRHMTSAAAAVFSLPGAAPRHGGCFWDHGGLGVGFPHVRCRLADQYGIEGAGSGLPAFTDSSLRCLEKGFDVGPLRRLLEGKEGSERELDWYSRSVSESELVL